MMNPLNSLVFYGSDVTGDQHRGLFGARGLLLLALLLIAAGSAQAWLLPRYFPHFHDSTVYLSGAKSIAEGTGYRFAGFEGHPGIGIFPPGQSLYLSQWWRLEPRYPENLSILYFAAIVMSAAASAAVFGVLREFGMPDLWSWLVAFCVAVGMRWVEHISWLMAEHGFIACSLGIAWLWLRRGSDSPAPLGLWFVTGVAVALALLFRTAAIGIAGGLFLVAAYAAWSRRDLRVLIFGVAPVAVAVGWCRSLSQGWVTYSDVFARTLMLEGGGLKAVVRVVGEQLLEFGSGRPVWDNSFNLVSRVPLWVHSKSAIFGWMMIVGAAVMCSGLLFLAARGVSLVSGRSKGGVLVCAASYAALVLVAPNGANGIGRYTLPLIPFFFGCAWKGAESCGFLRSPKLRGVALVCLVVVGIGGNLFMSLRSREFWTSMFNRSEVEEVARWLAERSRKDWIIAVDWSQPWFQIHCATGIDFVQNPFCSNRILPPVRPSSVRPTHVVVHRAGWDQYSPTAAFERVYSTTLGQWEVWKVPVGD